MSTTANCESEMYQRGYDDSTIRFAYIPDFATKQNEIDWCAGIIAGDTNRRHRELEQLINQMNASKSESRCAELTTHWKRCIDNIRIFCDGFDNGSNNLAIADALISAYEMDAEQSGEVQR